MEIPSKWFFPSSKHLVVSKPGNVLVPLLHSVTEMSHISVKGDAEQGCSPVNAKDLVGGNSTKMPVSDLGSWLSVS